MRNTRSPFSACTMQMAPRSRACVKLAISVASSTMMAFLYAMKCLKLFTPCSWQSMAISFATCSPHHVTAMWKL